MGSVVVHSKHVALGLSSVIFEHVQRQFNILAHVLTKSFMNSSGLSVFIQLRSVFGGLFVMLLLHK